MSKITVIGAGKTGRGFIGRLIKESNLPFSFIDKDEALVKELESRSFKVSFSAM